MNGQELMQGLQINDCYVLYALLMVFFHRNAFISGINFHLSGIIATMTETHSYDD